MNNRSNQETTRLRPGSVEKRDRRRASEGEELGFFVAESFTLTGAPKTYIKVADSGNRRVHAFCPECGAPVMRAGTCGTQPPSIKHAVLDYSDDFEALEVLLPADFETVTLA